MPLTLLMGLRHLRARRHQAFISFITTVSIAGIAIGVMAMIVVLAVMTGFEEDLKEKILGFNAHVLVQTPGPSTADPAAALPKLAQVKGVTFAAPFVLSQVMVKGGGENVSGVVLKGMDPKDLKRLPSLQKALAGRGVEGLEPVGGTPGVLLGKELAGQLGVLPGDEVELISPFGTPTPMGMVPKVRKFRVAGVFGLGLYEVDAAVVLAGLKTAQGFLDMQGQVTGIELRIADIYRARTIAREVQETLGFPYLVRDWMDMNQGILRALRVEKTAMFVILMLIVLVAAFDIVTTLVMVVMEKRKDIAILKVMGARDGQILGVFMLQGFVIGLAGILLGVAAGILLAMNVEVVVRFFERVFSLELFPKEIYSLDRFPSKLEVEDMLRVCAMTALACLAATLYPALMALKVEPTEILRYE